MEGEKAAGTVNEELHFQSSPVDFEAIFSLLKSRQSENESRVFYFRKIYRRKMNKVSEEEKRERSLIESDAGRFTDERDQHGFICTLKYDETTKDLKLQCLLFLL